MVDALKLRAQFRTAVIACLGVTAAPFLLSYVAFILASSPEGDFDPVRPSVLIVFGLMALSPLVTGPVIRRYARRSLQTPLPPRQTLEGNMGVWAITEYAIWEISSLLGFVGFVLYGKPAFMLGCVLVSLAGFVYAFPRWDRWVAQLEELGLVDAAFRLSASTTRP